MGREPEHAHTILICDDNTEFRALLGAVVDSMPGMSVVGQAADGEAAISEAARLQPDVILLDLAMPRLTGLDALPRLRHVAGAAKIIVLTGFSALVVSEQVLALGANHYLEKGADIETISAAIEDVLVVADTEHGVTL
jgi:DNA-binding NarL/FixJ family response regulator